MSISMLLRSFVFSMAVLHVIAKQNDTDDSGAERNTDGDKPDKINDILNVECEYEDDKYSCFKWKRIENGYCESVHGYEAYSYRELDRLMQVAEGHPTQLYIEYKDKHVNRTFTFAFCSSNQFQLNTKDDVDERDLRKRPTLRAMCDTTSFAFLSEEYELNENDHQMVEQQQDKIFCEYSFGNPQFRPAYYDRAEQNFKGYIILFEGQNYKKDKDFYVMFDVKCDTAHDADTIENFEWLRDETVTDDNLVIYKWRGRSGCVVKEFRGEYYFKYMTAPLKMLIGVFLIFKGSANFYYTLAILCMMTGHLILRQLAFLIKFTDVTAVGVPTKYQLQMHAVILGCGYFIGMFVFI